MTTNYSAGHDAEKDAAVYLANKGYEIVELNWKIKTCEIDIVAKKNRIMFFVEVKSRKSSNQGSAIEYITAIKLHQMTYAAEAWTVFNEWKGDYRLAVIAIDAGDITLTEL